MKLGFDTYSYRLAKLDVFGFLEAAKELGLDGVMYSGMDGFKSLEEPYVLKVRHKAEEMNLYVEAGMNSYYDISKWEKTPALKDDLNYWVWRLEKMLKVAHTLGSPVLRTFLGHIYNRLASTPISEQIEKAIAILKKAAPIAEGQGVKIGLENHCDLTSKEMLTIIEEVDSEYVRVCLDTGNPLTVMENPVYATEILAPYTCCTHFKDAALQMTEEGLEIVSTPLGKGNVDLVKITKILKDKCADINLSMEVHSEVTFPGKVIFDESFWRAFPTTTPYDLSLMLSMVWKGAKKPALMEDILLMDEAEEGELRKQEFEHLKISTKYAREELGIGK